MHIITLGFVSPISRFLIKEIYRATISTLNPSLLKLCVTICFLYSHFVLFPCFYYYHIDTCTYWVLRWNYKGEDMFNLCVINTRKSMINYFLWFVPGPRSDHWMGRPAQLHLDPRAGSLRDGASHRWVMS